MFMCPLCIKKQVILAEHYGKQEDVVHFEWEVDIHKKWFNLQDLYRGQFLGSKGALTQKFQK